MSICVYIYAHVYSGVRRRLSWNFQRSLKHTKMLMDSQADIPSNAKASVAEAIEGAQQITKDSSKVYSQMGEVASGALTKLMEGMAAQIQELRKQRSDMEHFVEFKQLPAGRRSNIRQCACARIKIYTHAYRYLYSNISMHLYMYTNA